MGMSREALEAVRGEVALLCYCHRPGGGEDNNNDARGEEQDVLLTMRMRCPMTGGRQRRERVTLMVAAMTNTSTDVSGVHVGQIPKMGDGRVHGAIVTMRTRTRRTATRELAARLRSAGGGQRRKRATSTVAATMNTLMGMSGVCIGWILGIGNSRACIVMATMTTMTTSVDCIPPRG